MSGSYKISGSDGMWFNGDDVMVAVFQVDAYILSVKT